MYHMYHRFVNNKFSIILKQLIREGQVDWLRVRYIRTRLDAVITVPLLLTMIPVCMYPITFIVYM